MTDHSTRPSVREHSTAPTRNSAPNMDEALARASAASLNAVATTLLVAIADKLTSHRPEDRVLEQTRLALACTFATREYGFTEATDELERVLQRRMPLVARDITRGEYALILRAAADGAAAVQGGA